MTENKNTSMDLVLASEFSTDIKLHKNQPSYRQLAAINPVNAVGVLGLLTVALLTGQWWLVLVTGVLETLWVVFAPTSVFLRAHVLQPMRDKEQQKWLRKRRQANVRKLHPVFQARWRKIEALTKRVLGAMKNPRSPSAHLLQQESGRLEQSINDFLELALFCQQAQVYQNMHGQQDFEAELQVLVQKLQDAPSPPEAKALQNKRTLLANRKQRLQTLQEQMRAAEAEMDVIETSWELLADDFDTPGQVSEITNRLHDMQLRMEAMRQAQQEMGAID